MWQCKFDVDNSNSFFKKTFSKSFETNIKKENYPL